MAGRRHDSTTGAADGRRSPLAAVVVVAAMVVAALGPVSCGTGTDDGGQQDEGGGRGRGQQEVVADRFIEVVRSSGAGSKMDERCIRAVAAELSDESAAAIVAASDQGVSARDEPGLRAIEDELLGCIANG